MTRLKRVLIGKETVAAFAALLVAMAVIPHLVLTYYPIALATYVRNVHFASIGMGPVFYLIALVGVYIEAVIFGSLFRVFRTGYMQMNVQKKAN